jgi:tryptophanyl-tRNA synthetase
MAETYRRGGFGYGEIKKALHAAAEQFFAEARTRREALAADPATIDGILEEGAARAREQATRVLDRARAACGLSRGRGDR